jgi:hypothetical protein
MFYNLRCQCSPLVTLLWPCDLYLMKNFSAFPHTFSSYLLLPCSYFGDKICSLLYVRMRCIMYSNLFFLNFTMKSEVLWIAWWHEIGYVKTVIFFTGWPDIWTWFIAFLSVAYISTRWYVYYTIFHDMKDMLQRNSISVSSFVSFRCLKFISGIKYFVNG